MASSLRNVDSMCFVVVRALLANSAGDEGL